ncbi:hypothetical protein [Burkholderia sp. Bp8998]|nr:hypothetical protein [Burkholderia sp. Bp8998]
MRKISRIMPARAKKIADQRMREIVLNLQMRIMRRIEKLNKNHRMAWRQK